MMINNVDKQTSGNGETRRVMMGGARWRNVGQRGGGVTCLTSTLFEVYSYKRGRFKVWHRGKVFLLAGVGTVAGSATVYAVQPMVIECFTELDFLQSELLDDRSHALLPGCLGRARRQWSCRPRSMQAAQRDTRPPRPLGLPRLDVWAARSAIKRSVRPRAGSTRAERSAAHSGLPGLASSLPACLSGLLAATARRVETHSMVPY